MFTAGTSASRSVAENTAAGVNIGAPVTATDADRDTLTYTVGGDDGSAFAVNSTTGQLKTKSALDFETKSSYRVTMGVTDSNGEGDTITVTITVTDVADVSLVSGTTQMIGVVDSEQDTTVSTLDGSVAVTFPSGSRGGDYQVRLDYGVTNCNANFSGEELWFCLTVDIFDNEGNLEQGVVLSQPATIKIRRNGDERGGVDAVLGLHAQGGVSVYTRGRTGGEWTESAFTLESDGVGGIVITITGVSSFGLYAGTTDSSVPVQVSHQAATVPVPTDTPQNTGGRGSSPEPTPTPTPTPQPGSSPEQSATPDPTPTPAPVVTRGTNPTPEPTLGHQVSAPFGPLGGSGGNAASGADSGRHRQGTWKPGVGFAAGWRLGTNSRAGSQSGFVRFGRREIRRDAVVVRRDHNDGAGGDDSRRQHVRCEAADQGILPRNSAEKPRVQ